LSKGITENKNSNPRPRKRETSFSEPAGVSFTKILHDPSKPRIYHRVQLKAPLSRILSLPGHFLISSLIRCLCSKNRSILKLLNPSLWVCCPEAWL
jgi:hypothetical protein